MAASIVNPLNNPYFGPVESGDGMASLGNGNGLGFYDWSGLSGTDQFIRPATGNGDNMTEGSIDAQALTGWLNQNGLQLMQDAVPGQNTAVRWLQDRNGNVVGQKQYFSQDDSTFMTAMMLAAAVVGGGIAAGGASAGGGAAAASTGGGLEGIGATYGAIDAGTIGGGSLLTGSSLGTAEVAGLEGLIGAGTAGGAGYGYDYGGGDGSAIDLSGGGGGGEFNEAGITNPNFGQGADFASVSAGNGGGMSGQWIDGISNGQLLNLGGNLLSGYLGSNAAGKAANAQLDAGRESNALQKYMYDTTRADFAPYREAGTTALAGIQALLKDPSSISSMPDYQFGMDQGTKALNSGAASRGMTYSGAQGKALQQYGNDYAGTKLNESYNRLAGVAGIGQQATGSTASAGVNYGNQVGNTLQNMGNARGSGYVGSANAWGNAFGNALNNYQQDEMYRNYFGGGG